ncbi:hypothetical protein HYY74_05725 [Candidatus Woesearchaeota archaeon]|nr:hypothetical protein [Candidatus Woesearchaeota archaeon]
MPTALEDRLRQRGQNLLDRVRRINVPRRPIRVQVPKEQALEAARGFFRPQTTEGDLDALTDKLMQKYDVLRRVPEGEREQVWNLYRTAVKDSYDRYGKMLDGGIRVDKVDRILAGTEFTTIIPGVGDVIDFYKDVGEVALMKLPHGVMEYFVRPVFAGERVHLGRFMTLAAVEAASFIPRVGAFIDFMHLYKKMAADTLITDAYNQLNPGDRRGYDPVYYLEDAFGDILGRQRRTLPYDNRERPPTPEPSPRTGAPIPGLA